MENGIHPALIKKIVSLTLSQFLLILIIIGVAFADVNDTREILNQQLSLEIKDKSLKEVLTNIESKANVKFAYSRQSIQAYDHVSLTASNEKLGTVLDKLLNPRQINYEVIGKQIVLNKFLSLKAEEAIFNHNINQNVVSGQVISDTNEPLPGVSVRLLNTLTGTITNIDGQYSLPLPDGGGVLVFSYIGYVSQEISIGGRTTIDVQLAEDVKSLNEVVVTALGIKRESKALGYAVAVVAADAITENRTTSTLGTLQGKIAGVNITSPTTGPQGSSRIRIRGNSSFSGANTPLIVINGVPVDNTRFGSIALNNSDGGDGLSSINPDDIESMTVLKGAAAAALYGSRAKDGVVMVTTKSGSTGSRGWGVDYNVNFTTETPLDFTDFQYEYGQGERGVRPTTPNPTSGIWSYGEKFQPGMTQVLFDGIELPYEPVFNRVKAFYEVGRNLTNTISLSNNGENGGFNLSFSNTDNKSIVPNSDFNRKTINLGFTQIISKNLSTHGNINYSNEYNRNPAQVGGQEFATPSAVFTIANSMPFDLLKENRVNADGNEYVYSRFLPRTNPYFSVYEHFENIKRDRLFGNLALKFQLTDWLYLQGRLAQDFYTREQDYNYPTGYAAIGPAPAGYVNGSYFKNSQTFRERNYDFLIGGDRTFNDFGIDFTFGGNQMYRRSDTESLSTQDFIERGLYTIMNGRTRIVEYGINERQVNSLYGAAGFSFRNYIYLNVTGRNDWFSTLSSNNRSIFYPSATASYVFSDAFNYIPKWLSFGKFRLAYAQVGDDNVAAYSNDIRTTHCK
ncbi:hypothetical protein BH23BAC1_BH23BAC1_19910 [soil metagenome]